MNLQETRLPPYFGLGCREQAIAGDWLRHNTSTLSSDSASPPRSRKILVFRPRSASSSSSPPQIVLAAQPHLLTSLSPSELARKSDSQVVMH